MSLMFSLKDKKGFRIKKSNNLLRFMHSHISQSQKAFLLIATLFHLYIIDKMDKVRKVKWDRYACHLELCVIYGALSLSCSQLNHHVQSKNKKVHYNHFSANTQILLLWDIFWIFTMESIIFLIYKYLNKFLEI